MSFLAIFEDAAATNFLPLTWTRPVWDLRCGIWTLREAIEEAYGQPADALFVRDFLADVVRERTKLPVNEPSLLRSPAAKSATQPWEGNVKAGMYLLLNGRLLASPQMAQSLPMSGEPCRFVTPPTPIRCPELAEGLGGEGAEGTLLGAWVPAELLREGWQAIDALPAKEVEWPLVQWPWELFHQNGAQITVQAQQKWALGNLSALNHDHPGVHLLHPEQIFVHPTARLMPGVVLDASDGPIV
ncbi:MAG: putative sugar nucleotidyl transferase, partial [Ardenticatenaceae bacterium]